MSNLGVASFGRRVINEDLTKNQADERQQLTQLGMTSPSTQISPISSSMSTPSPHLRRIEMAPRTPVPIRVETSNKSPAPITPLRRIEMTPTRGGGMNIAQSSMNALKRLEESSFERKTPIQTNAKLSNNISSVPPMPLRPVTVTPRHISVEQHVPSVSMNTNVPLRQPIIPSNVIKRGAMNSFNTAVPAEQAILEDRKRRQAWGNRTYKRRKVFEPYKELLNTYNDYISRMDRDYEVLRSGNIKNDEMGIKRIMEIGYVISQLHVKMTYRMIMARFGDEVYDFKYNVINVPIRDAYLDVLMTSAQVVMGARQQWEGIEKLLNKSKGDSSFLMTFYYERLMVLSVLKLLKTSTTNIISLRGGLESSGEIVKFYRPDNFNADNDIDIYVLRRIDEMLSMILKIFYVNENNKVVN